MIFIIIQLLLYYHLFTTALKEILYNTLNQNFPNSIFGTYLNFSLNHSEYEYITNNIIPNLYFFIKQ